MSPVNWSSRKEERHINKMRRNFVRDNRLGAKKKAKTALQTIEELNKRFGAGAIGPVISSSLKVPCVSLLDPVMDDWLTGATRLNDDGKVETVKGSGRGLPRGRVIEIAGPESSGKTTWCLEAIAAYQQQGFRCAFVDAEHALNLEYVANLGIDMEDWLLSQPDCGEEAMDITHELAKSGAIDLIVVDSVAALVPTAELEKGADETTIGLQAKLMSTGLRKLTAILSKSGCTVVFVNQIREKINIGWGSGPTETTSGGKALRFYASIRIDIRSVGKMMKGTTVAGQRSRVKSVKNKMATPFRECYVEITFGEGITNVIPVWKRKKT